MIFCLICVFFFELFTLIKYLKSLCKGYLSSVWQTSLHDAENQYLFCYEGIEKLRSVRSHQKSQGVTWDSQCLCQSDDERNFHDLQSLISAIMIQFTATSHSCMNTIQSIQRARKHMITWIFLQSQHHRHHEWWLLMKMLLFSWDVRK